jgi:hypothetical protein
MDLPVKDHMYDDESPFIIDVHINLDIMDCVEENAGLKLSLENLSERTEDDICRYVEERIRQIFSSTRAKCRRFGFKKKKQKDPDD